MVNTYQHISFAQLVYFSYICARQGLASYKHLSNAASHFSAEIYLSLFCRGRNLPLQLLLAWKYMTSSALTCCLSNLTLFPSEVLLSKLLQASKSRHPLTHFWIHKVSLGEIIWQENSQKQVAITSLVQGFSSSSSHKAYHWIVPHSFLGAPWEGKPGGAAPGGKPIRPDCPMSPAYNAAYDVAAAEFAAEAESPAADACK